MRKRGSKSKETGLKNKKAKGFCMHKLKVLVKCQEVTMSHSINQREVSKEVIQ
jgi:hypothetical protein